MADPVPHRRNDDRGSRTRGSRGAGATTPAPADPNAPVAPAPPADRTRRSSSPGAADPNAPVVPGARCRPRTRTRRRPTNAPVPLRRRRPGVNNALGGFSYVVPGGWVVADASRLNYGQALLSKEIAPSQNGQPATTANDTSVLLGRLDLKLFAGAERDNARPRSGWPRTWAVLHAFPGNPHQPAERHPAGR